MKHLSFPFLVVLLIAGFAGGESESCCLSPCEEDPNEASWVFQPSYFSHDPDTGQRVAQYMPIPKVYLTIDPTYQESGFRYTQQYLRGAGNSFDALHLVQTWGQGEYIRPYGEWERPYRAGATPFGPWGNPQGPWTLPFDSWQNPYGLGQLPNPFWPVYPGPTPPPYAPYDQPNPGNGIDPRSGMWQNTPSPNGGGMNYPGGGMNSNGGGYYHGNEANLNGGGYYQGGNMSPNGGGMQTSPAGRFPPNTGAFRNTGG